MNLADLITTLEAADPTLAVPRGFTNPHSYRGDYMDLAFEPATDVTVADMLADARSALGATYQGWKGGDFTMGEHTWCWLSVEGDASGETISALLVELLLAEAARPSVVSSPAAPADGCAHRGPHPGFTCAEVDQTRPFWNARWDRPANGPRCTCAGVGFGDGGCTVHNPAVPADTTRHDRYTEAIHNAMESDLSLADQEPEVQALFARAAEAAAAVADAEQADLRAEVANLRTMYGAATAREEDLIEERDELHAQANLHHLTEVEFELRGTAETRAEAFREAADALGRMDYDADSNDYGYDTYRDAWNGGVMDGAELLRRLAAETQQPAEPSCCSDPTCTCVQVNAEGRCECVKWETAGARQQPDTETPTPRCAHCTHPKRDHDGRTDHHAKYSPLVAGEPWCHACNTECDYVAADAPAPVRQPAAADDA